MSEPTSKRSAGTYCQSDDVRDRVLAAARPVDLSEDEKIELSEDEAEFFFETIRNA